MKLPNPFHKEPVESGAPPINPDVPEPDPGAAQRRRLLTIAIICVAILVAFMAAPAILLNTRKKPNPTPSTSLSITPRPSVDPNATSQLGPERVFLEVSATSRVPYDITLTVPQAWEASFSSQTSKAYPWEDSILVRAILSRFSPLSSSNTVVTSGNYIAMMNITGWLNTAKNVVPLTPAQKQSWWSNLASVNPENYARISAASPNPRLASEPGGRQHLQPVATAENGFKGISYITNTSTSDYTPQIILMLVGTYEGRKYVIYAQHNVRDQAWAAISALRARNDSGAPGQVSATVSDFARGVINQDTIAIHDEFLRAIQTLSFKTVN